MTSVVAAISGAELCDRIRREYREMPGLCLTVAQAARLWQVERDLCVEVLEALACERVLRRLGDRYVSAEGWA